MFLSVSNMFNYSILQMSLNLLQVYILINISLKYLKSKIHLIHLTYSFDTSCLATQYLVEYCDHRLPGSCAPLLLPTSGQSILPHIGSLGEYPNSKVKYTLQQNWRKGQNRFCLETRGVGGTWRKKWPNNVCTCE
jgi:hypothetical protein